MDFKDKKHIETNDKKIEEPEEVKKVQTEAAEKKQEWWKAALYPDPPYVSDR